jgi:hypothetical protein
MTIQSQPMISEADYTAIEGALQSTQKGRRFLRVYLERNRSLESRRLLRSISRLHNAALGGPGVQAEISRDLVSMAKSVARNRKLAAACPSVEDQSRYLSRSLQDVEASLIALIESLDERRIEAAGEEMDPFAPHDSPPVLHAELSSYFSGDRF